MKLEIKDFREKIIKDMEDTLDERLRYIVPYKKFQINSPEQDNEIEYALEDVYLVAKEKIMDQYGNTKKYFEIYGEDGVRQATQDLETDRIRLDKEITEELIRKFNQIKKIAHEQGRDIVTPEISKERELDSYFEYHNQKLTVINKREKDSLEKAKASGKEEEEKYRKKLEEKTTQTEEDKQKKVELVASDLGIAISDVARMQEIRDDLFFENNPDVARDSAYVVQDNSGKIFIVSNKGNGKFEKSKGFENSTSQESRANVLTNDNNNVKENNTFGTIYSTVNKDYRYAIAYDQYHGIKLIEERRITQNESGKTMSEGDEWLGRNVELSNTASYELNREGSSITNEVRNKFYGKNRWNRDVNAEAAKLRELKQNEKEGDKINVEDLADENYPQRVVDTFEKIKKAVEEKGEAIDSADEDKLKEKINEKYEENPNEMFTDEDIEDKAEKYIAYKQTKEKIDKIHEKHEHEDEGRTLEGDALERLENRRRYNQNS